MKKIQTSLLSRFPKILSTAVNVVFDKNPDSIVGQLSELKGIPQKIGQLLSMDMTHFVPSELRDKLRELQGESKTLDFQNIENIIALSLGQEKFRKVTLNPNPIGAGSIGQVHRGRVDLERQVLDVVFKVKYPNLQHTITTDLKLFKPMLLAFSLIKPNVKDFEILMEEARAMLLLELDYEAEVKNLLKFRNSLAPDQRFLIPNVIHDFSSHDIICMEFIQGTTLSKVLELGELKEEEKKYLADTLLDLFLKEFFEFKMMQTDPNFANYLIQKDNTVNALKVVLLDFGATKQFSVEFVKKYFQLIEGIYFNDREKILKVSYELGIFSEKEDSAVKAIYLEFIQHCVQLFQKENNPYDFSKEDLSKKLFESGVKLFKLQRYSQPHSEMVFLHRKIGGLFSLLVKLKVQIDLNSFWSKIEHYGRQL